MRELSNEEMKAVSGGAASLAEVIQGGVETVLSDVKTGLSNLLAKLAPPTPKAK